MTGMSTWPQPHEGVTGTERDDPFLSLDEAIVPVRDWLRGFARHLQRATLVGDPAPVVARMFDRITHPQPGDLVVESSTLYRPFDDTVIKGVGFLVLERREWWQTDEEYQADIAADAQYADEERTTDHAWYIQYGPHAVDICRWTNCSFVVLPRPDEQFDLPIGTPTGNGVTLTRSDVLSGLADGGFKLRTDA